MRREHFNLRPEDVEQCASSILHDNVKLKGSGRKCHAQVLWHVVLYAAAQISSIAAACGRLKNVPGDDAVRNALAAGLPSIGVLGRRLNNALLDCIAWLLARPGSRMNQARIRTCTRQPLLRLFYVGVALLLRNLWVWFHLTLLSQPRRGGRQIRLDKLRLRAMNHWLVHFLETEYDTKRTADAYLPSR